MPAHTQDGMGRTGQLAYELGHGPEGVALLAHRHRRTCWLVGAHRISPQELGRVGGHLPSRARFTPKPIAAMVNIRPRIAISSAAITPHFPRCSGHMSNLSTAEAMPHSKPSDTKQPGPSAAYVPSSC
jgi:hypothetical protein